MHPAIAELLKFFHFGNIEHPLANALAKRYAYLAYRLAEDLDGAEVTIALRALLDSRNACLRAALGHVNMPGLLGAMGLEMENAFGGVQLSNVYTGQWVAQNTAGDFWMSDTRDNAHVFADEGTAIAALYC